MTYIPHILAASDSSMTRPSRRRSLSLSTAALLALALAFAATDSVRANNADGTWGGSASGNWSLATNWASSVIPGATGTGTTDTSTAFFGGTTAAAITLDTSYNLKSFTFNGTSAAYTIGASGGSVFSLTSAGAITVNSTVTANQTINAPLLIGNNASTYTFSNAVTVAASGGGLTIGGPIQSVGTTGSLNLTLNSAVTAWYSQPAPNINTISGAISDSGTGTTTAITKTGAGLWVLSGTNTYSGATTISQGVLRATDTVGLPSTSNLVISGPVNGIVNSQGSTFQSGGNFTRSLGTAAGQVQFIGGSTAEVGIEATPGGNITVAFGGIGTEQQITWGQSTFNMGLFLIGDTNASSNGATASSVNFTNPINLNGGTRFIGVSKGVAATLSGVISGSGTLSVGGGVNGGYNGATVLSTNNTYTGTTTINGGTVSVASINNTTAGVQASSSSLGVPSAGNDTITIGASAVGGALGYTGGGETTNRAINVAAGGTAVILNNGSGALVFTGGVGLVSTAGALFDLGKNGSVGQTNTTSTNQIANIAIGSTPFNIDGGIWELTGSNSYSGLLTVGGTAILTAAPSSSGSMPGAVSYSGTIKLNNATNGGLPTGTVTTTGSTSTLQALTSSAGTLANNFILTSTTQSVVSGSNSVTINGSVTNSGGNRTLNSSTSAGSLTLAGSVYLSEASGTGRGLTINGTGNTTISGVIANFNGSGTAGNLVVSNTGTTTLSNANTYSGTTTVSGGALVLNNANALPGGIGATGGTSALTLSGGVIGLGTGDFTRALGAGASQVQIGIGGFAAYGADRAVNLGGASAGVTFGSGSFVTTLTSANYTLILGASSADHTVDFQNPMTLSATNTDTIQVNDGSAAIDAKLTGVISSTDATGGFIKTGAGTLLSASANTYTNATTVAQGTMLVGANAPSGSVGVFGNASSAVTLGSITLTGVASILTNGAFTIGRNITEIAGTPTTTFSIGGLQSSGTSTYTGNITLTKATTLTSATGGEVDFTTGVISGTFDTTIDGGGTVKLTGTNTFGTGKTMTIQSGTTLIASASANLGNSTNALTFNNGTLQFGGVFDPSSRTMSFSSGGATFNTSGNAITFASAVGNSGAGGLTKIGTSSLTLSGANTYTGTTTVNAGTLAEGSTGSIADASALTVDGSSAIFDLGASHSDTVATVTLANGGSITGSGTSALTSTGTFEMKSGSVSAILAGSGIVLNKTTTGSVSLSGANTYTGATSVSAGVLTAKNNAALGTTAGGTSVTSGAALALDGTAGALTIGAEALTLNGAGVTASPAGALQNVAGANTFGGLLTLGSDSTIQSDAGSLALSNVGTITGSGFGLTLTGATGGSIASIIGTGSGTLTKTGAGNWTLSGANTYTGLTSITGGTLTYGASDVIASGGVTVNGSGATLALGSNTDTVGTVTVDGGGSITGSGTLTSTGSFEMKNGSVSANLAGSGIGLNKTTSSTATLSGANTYTGGTTVTLGTLVVSSTSALGTGTVSIASGATVSNTVTGGFNFTNHVTNNGTIDSGGHNISFASGKTLNGSGTLQGGGTFTVLGTLSPGNSPGTVTVGTGTTLTLDAGATTIWQLNALVDNSDGTAGTNWDTFVLNGTGVMNLNGTLQIALDGISFSTALYWETNHAYTLFSGGTVNNSFVSLTGDVTYTNVDGTGTFSPGGNNLNYTWVAVPEPQTWALAALGLSAVLFRLRRKQRNH